MSIRQFIEDRRPMPEELRGGIRQARRELGGAEQLARIRAGLARRLQSAGGGSVPPLAGGVMRSGWSRGQLLMLVGASLGALLALLWAADARPVDTGLALQSQSMSTRDVAARPSYVLLGRASEPVVEAPPQPEQPTHARVARRRGSAVEPSAADTAAPLDPRGELAILRAAQLELRSRPSSSLEHVHEHQARYPRGVFAQEREVIRIDALFALRRDGEARDRARDFLDEYGNSTHAPRVRSLLGAP